MVDSSVLTSQHWDTYVIKILEVHGEHPNVIEKCGHHYRLGFIDGFKYGKESEGEEVDSRALASKQWELHFRKILEGFGEEPDLIRKCGVHYRLAFIHGFKHGVESEKEAKVHY